METKALSCLIGLAAMLCTIRGGAEFGLCPAREGLALTSPQDGKYYCPHDDYGPIETNMPDRVLSAAEVNAKLTQVTNPLGERIEKLEKLASGLDTKLSNQVSSTSKRFESLHDVIGNDPEAARQIANSLFAQRPQLLVGILVEGLKKNQALARDLRATLEQTKP